MFQSSSTRGLREARQSIEMTFGPAVFDGDVRTVNETGASS
jgi:hypothetical protein